MTHIITLDHYIMKIKHILIVLILGVVFTIAGSLFKILHYIGATQLLILGMGLQVVAGLLAIWKLITSKNSNSFLNK